MIVLHPALLFRTIPVGYQLKYSIPQIRAEHKNNYKQNTIIRNFLSGFKMCLRLTELQNITPVDADLTADFDRGNESLTNKSISGIAADTHESSKFLHRHHDGDIFIRSTDRIR